MTVRHEKDFELKKLTTFKVGGKASDVYFPESKEELVSLLQSLESYIVLGSASNVIVSSLGVDENVIFTTAIRKFDFDGENVTAGCGVRGPLLSQNAKERGLSGFEFMIGFPGSVGGLVYMNASAHNQSVSDSLVSCEVFDPVNKEVLTLEKSDMRFGYRKSLLQEKKYILLEAVFRLQKSEKPQIETIMARNIEYRRLRQPSLALPNAGSIFKNPENDTAGRLLDIAGAKTLSSGGARVFDQHANFIINADNAESSDILNLMLNMHNLVYEKYRVRLRPEPEFIGTKTKREAEIWDILQNS